MGILQKFGRLNLGILQKFANLNLGILQKRIDKYLVYTKDYRADRDVVLLPVYMAQFL